MHALVTGAAGFIGSHLCDHLLACGDTVIGLDAFTDTYDPARKARNLVSARLRPGFTLHCADLLQADLAPLLDGVDTVFHLAGQPGVRTSWGKEFALYTERNVLATQRLLEAVRARSLRKLVHASSSSVYGDASSFPTAETVCPQPVSPYGVTKLAGERLCEVYRQAYGVPAVSLRLFTVYGPRQRPDMAFARLIAAAAAGRPFVLYGDGNQTRDFTSVHDVVRAMRDAAESGFTGVANLGGGSAVTLHEAVTAVERLVGPIALVRRPASAGDARHTGADIRLARAAFGFRPSVGLREGLAEMAGQHAPPDHRHRMAPTGGEPW